MKNWINKPYAKSYLTKGLEALKEICIQFVYKNDRIDSQVTKELPPSTPNTAGSCDNTFGNIFGYGSQVLSHSNNMSEAYIFKRNRDLDNEISFFSSLLGDKEIISYRSTKKFWGKFRIQLPNLFDLQVILLNISASTAFIERFFSISGIVCDIKRATMEEDLIIMRSMMKANISILNSMN